MPTEQVTARELKNRTGAVLRRVRGGARVVVTNRGRPVAVIVPPGSEPPPVEPDAETRWREIDAALAASPPELPTWQEAMRRSRSRP